MKPFVIDHPLSYAINVDSTQKVTVAYTPNGMADSMQSGYLALPYEQQVPFNEAY